MFKRKKLEIEKAVDQRKKKEVCLRETISSFRSAYRENVKWL